MKWGVTVFIGSEPFLLATLAEVERLGSDMPEHCRCKPIAQSL